MLKRMQEDLLSYRLVDRVLHIDRWCEVLFFIFISLRPLAGFEVSCAITFFAPFDPILLIDILHRSRKPQKYL